MSEKMINALNIVKSVSRNVLTGINGNRKIIGFWVISMCLSWFAASKMLAQPIPPQPEPIVIQWEIDKEYGDKHTTLANGLSLSVFQDGEGANVTWGWSVSGDAVDETAAIKKAMQMGGVR